MGFVIGPRLVAPYHTKTKHDRIEKRRRSFFSPHCWPCMCCCAALQCASPPRGFCHVSLVFHSHTRRRVGKKKKNGSHWLFPQKKTLDIMFSTRPPPKMWWKEVANGTFKMSTSYGTKHSLQHIIGVCWCGLGDWSSIT
jgi:hypothetical protein